MNKFSAFLATTSVDEAIIDFLRTGLSTAIAVLKPVRRKSMIASSTEVVARNAVNLFIGSPSSSR